MKKLILLLFAIPLLISCDQWTAKNFGGTMTIKLEKGQKLMEATWKNGNGIWYLTEPMDSGYTPKTKVFTEKSLAGVLQGKVIFVEQK